MTTLYCMQLLFLFLLPLVVCEEPCASSSEEQPMLKSSKLVLEAPTENNGGVRIFNQEKQSLFVGIVQ